MLQISRLFGLWYRRKHSIHITHIAPVASLAPILQSYLPAQEQTIENFVILSGCSGGGKSALLSALADLGHVTIDEPGRRVVEAEQASGGSALPWQDMRAFLTRVMELARADHDAARAHTGPVFFDRSLIDALTAWHHLTGSAELAPLAEQYRYARTVFLTPPWPEIYETDSGRQHGLDEARAEYDRLLTAYPAHGYDTVLLPKVPVAERVSFLLGQIGMGAKGD